MGGLVEAIVDVAVDNAGLTDRLVAQKDDLDLDLAGDGAGRTVHLT